MNPLSRYILTQSAIGAVINMLMGVIFFMLLFGGYAHVPVWGMGGLVADFVPQGFCAGLASLLPPSLITRARLKKGTLSFVAGTLPRPLQALLPRYLFLAVLSMVLLVGGSALLALISGVQTFAFWPALLGKMLVGALLAFILTPIALRSMLVQPA